MYTYILDEQGKPKLTSNLYEWAEWYCSADQSILTVARTDILNHKGKILATVETRFSGQVESLSAKPLVWVTQQVGDDREIWRTDTLASAKNNHKRMVAMLERTYRK